MDRVVIAAVDQDRLVEGADGWRNFQGLMDRKSLGS